ncbi:MAG: hypothetical protein G01um101419_41 [Parcubacteria group bacterium Gr01-1014_19]|nr:MAG: hypothetical protein G01um101419_41 [Parcubacteria group bacterium Gr01-1014_19]
MFTLEAVKKNRAILIILVMALLLRLPGMGWGLESVIEYFEPDEWAHTQVAKEILNSVDNKMVPDAKVQRYWTTWGYGAGIGIASYPVFKTLDLLGRALLHTDLTIFARLVSLAFSLSLILLVFLVGQWLFNDRRKALLAAAVLALFDLNATYSHYGTPDIVHSFWFLGALFFATLYFFPNIGAISRLTNLAGKYSWILMTIASSAALAIRFDPIPMLAIAALYLWKMIQEKSSKLALPMIWFLALNVFLLFAFTGFHYSPEDFLKSYKKIVEDNRIESFPYGQSLYKPLAYILITAAGTSLPIILVAAASLLRIFKRKDQPKLKKIALLWSLILIGAFLLVYFGPHLSVRRINVFLPFVALAAAYGLGELLNSGEKLKKIAVYSVIGYTGLLAAISQAQFLNDPRYRAEQFILSDPTVAGATIDYTEYAKTLRMPGPSQIGPAAFPEIIVMQETFYGRFWKSLATPFKIPTCCDEVLHCKNYNQCVSIQAMLSGNSPYQLIKEFRLWHPFPERFVFQKLFGNYETFLGDVLIFRKI